jgi:hypothetical protein
VKKLAAKNQVAQQLDEQKVLQAARQVTVGDKDKTITEAPKSIMKKNTQENKQMQVVFNVDNDLSGFKTKSKQLIKEDDGVLKNLFVTQEEDALNEFEQEKNAEIENVLGEQVKKPEIRQGWGEWAGQGVDNSRHEQRKQKAEEKRNRKIEELKKQR